MFITERPFMGEPDWPLIASALDALPANARHVIDLPYRLSSPPMQTGENARLWLDDAGQIAGFAAWQRYWAVLDFFTLPSPQRGEIENAIFTWALPRFRAMDAARGRPLPYWAEYREDDTERGDLLVAHGFTLDEDYQYVQLHHPLGEALPVVSAPQGITIRPLVGEREVAAYVALHRAAFESESMTQDWRERTLRAPHHLPEIDLVAETEDGALVGFCLGWFDAAHRQGQVEPVGVAPGYHGRGIGRALLSEMLRRFAALGAERVIIETESTRSPALRLYESVGFRPQYAIVLKGRWAMRKD